MRVLEREAVPSGFPSLLVLSSLDELLILPSSTGWELSLDSSEL